MTAPPGGVELLGATGDRVSARVRPELNHPMFAGHFPGFPLMPGVYLVDFVHRAVLEAHRDFDVELVEVMSCRFLGPSFPGDELSADIGVTRSGESLLCAATVRTSRGPVAEVRFACRLME